MCQAQTKKTDSAPACVEGETVVLSCRAALGCWHTRHATEELKSLRPACSALRVQRDKLSEALVAEKALRLQDSVHAEEARLAAERQAWRRGIGLGLVATGSGGMVAPLVRARWGAQVDSTDLPGMAVGAVAVGVGLWLLLRPPKVATRRM